jgi:hypothetical protein
MGWRGKLVGGIVLGLALLAWTGTAGAALFQAIPARTYVGTVPKTNLTVFVKTDKTKGQGAKTGIAALECNVHLAAVNPTFPFTRSGGFLGSDRFTSAPGNTGNGTFDVTGRVTNLAGFAMKATVNVSQIPTCFNSKANATVRLQLANRKVTQRLAFELAQGVHFQSSLTPSCPPASAYNQQVTVGGRLSPDTGGTPVSISAANNRGGSFGPVKVPTAADGTFSRSFTPSPGPETKYLETVTMTFGGGAGRDPITATCSWQVGP